MFPVMTCRCGKPARVGVALIFAALAANTAENQTLSAQPPGMSVVEQKSPIAST